MVGVLLMVDVDPARRGLGRAVPTAPGYVNTFELGVVIYAVHRFGGRKALNFLARHAVVHSHLRRSPRADEEPMVGSIEHHVAGAVTLGRPTLDELALPRVKL